MFSQPGRGDLILAEFQAKLLAGEAEYPDPVEKRMVRVKRLIWRWALLVILVAGMLGWLFDVEIAAIGSIAVILFALALAWISRRRHGAQLASLNDQP